MLISVASDYSKLTVSSSDIDDVIANVGNYIGITVTVSKNCCDNTTYTYSLALPTISSDYFNLNTGLDILPAFIDEDEFIDGVYKVTIVIELDDNSKITEHNCLFVDNETNCNLAEGIINLEDDDKIHALMLHYGLIQGSGCGCNCDELCTLYNDLLKLLGSTDNSNCNCGY